MTTRRHFLKAAGATLMGTFALADADGARAERTQALPDVGRKFAADGRVLPFKGNTIICHLPQQGPESAMFDALLDIYRQLPGEGWVRKIAVLPPSSYHMTVFGGANDKERRHPLWPADLPLDLPIADCNRRLGDRLQAFRLGEDGPPYRMRIDPAAPAARATPLTMRLLPADADTETRLNRLRDRLADLLGIRAPDHAGYRFHVTLGYQVQPLAAEEDVAWRHALAAWKAEIVRRVPVFSLGAPEYCLLDDMFAFKREFYLV